MGVIGPKPDGSGGGSVTRTWLRALERTSRIGQEPTRTFPVLIQELARTQAQAPALLSDHESFTFGELAARANRYGRWFLASGGGRGSAVALMMPNRPEYLAVWLGITQVGGVVALLNTNLTGPSLAHCIAAVRPGGVIVAAELLAAVESALPHLPTPPRLWVHGATGGPLPPLDREIHGYDGGPLGSSEHTAAGLDDPALAIYTSGTTGRPKAARISHRRILSWALWFAGLLDTGPEDRMYNALPLYHSIGGVVATGAALVGGGSVVIRDRFSAREFWDDVVRWDCTLFQYIGELCRYLVAAPPHPRERGHRLRLAAGNGLRAGVWEAFQSRFAIPQILEFYAATEGNFSLYNVEGRPGAIGRVPGFMRHRHPARLVRFDGARGEPVRGEDGLCVPCRPGEVGEAVGRIGEGRAGADAFEGYTDRTETERKILRDVFAPGDAWFRTGDLMRQDEAGFFIFVDRIGDTFRWKGENVATGDVADAVAAFPGVLDATVYGVVVPGTEGRAGMAAIAAAPGLDLARLREHLARNLPDYARPLFLRLQGELGMTSTFKHTKAELAAEGFDPGVIADPLWFDDRARGSFVPLDRALFERIAAGEIRL